jgi:hypothetical protein
MYRRRVFSSNTEVTMSDHIKAVAQTAKQGKYFRIPIPESSVPSTLLEGTTSYLTMPVIPQTSCHLNKITLYPYGRFNPIVNHNKFVLI